jgi:hypothetical protein
VFANRINSKSEIPGPDLKLKESFNYTFGKLGPTFLSIYYPVYNPEHLSKSQ